MAKDVVVNVGPLRKFQAAFNRALAGTGAGIMRDMLKQWAVRYRSFAQTRFHKLSKGGGGWPALKPATIRRRRKGRSGSKASKAGNVAAILRDTNTLFIALDPVFQGKPGAVEQNIPFGVRVGYGGPQKHPGGKASIADIASFHQEGTDVLPARPIIVEPDVRTRTAMANDAVRAMQRLAQESGNA